MENGKCHNSTSFFFLNIHWGIGGVDLFLKITLQSFEDQRPKLRLRP
jgi:hypothetical protein